MVVILFRGRWINYQKSHGDTIFYNCIKSVYSRCPSITVSETVEIHTWNRHSHYNNVIIGAIASLITSLTIVYLSVYSDADQRKHQSSASLAFVRGIHRGPVNSPHKWPVTQKMFPFDDVIMLKWPARVLWSSKFALARHFICHSNILCNIVLYFKLTMIFKNLGV